MYWKTLLANLEEKETEKEHDRGHTKELFKWIL